MTGKRIARVFPRKTNMYPTDKLAFFGPPTLDALASEIDEVHISVTFTWDLEPSLLQPWQSELLKSINPKTMYTAYDTKDDYEPLRQMAKTMWDSGFRPSGHQVKCYCLCGYDGDSFDAAQKRMQQIMELGFLPFSMLYRDESGRVDVEWKRFQREWANSFIVGKKFSDFRRGCRNE